jgi:transglutaminase-like putative cysteine protease
MSDRATYRVVHETRYTYSDTVTSARQLAHLRPRATERQTLQAHRVEIDPAPSERVEDNDYFGNGVMRFAIDTPHDALVVRAESIVEVRRYAPDTDAGPPWETAVAAPGVWGPDDEFDLAQFRLASPMVPVLPNSVEYARPSFPAGRPLPAAMLDLTRRIHADFVYDPKATTVTTQVSEVLAHGRGVCQDFAHLMISCLRSLGLAARYVSGYILNSAPPGKKRLAGADASHAWVEGHCPGVGWIAFDPTNGKVADLEFITVAWGREFSDVTPLRGVVLGTATQTLAVAVNVEPVVRKKSARE